MDKHRKHLRFLLFTFSGLVLILLGAIFDVVSYLNIETIRSSIMPFGVFAPVVFVVVHALIVAFLLPGSPMTVASGVLFGPILGSVYSVVATVLGGSIIFFVSRFLGSYYLHDWLLSKNKRYYDYLKQSRGKGFLLTLTLRIVPLLPFNMLSIILGLTHVRFRDFFAGTLLGVIPSTLAFVYFGSSLASRNFQAISIGASFVLIAWLFGIGMSAHFKHKKNA